MERLNWHIADELSRHAQVHVIGPTGAAAQRPERVDVTEVPLRPLRKFLLASGHQSISIARRIKPHIVLAGSGLTAPAALIAARLAGARASVYLHGLDVAVRHPIYRALWHPAIRHMDTVIVNSRATARLTHTLGVGASKTHIVHPGVQLPDGPQSAATLKTFRQRHNLGDARIILSVGRLTTRKGLREFVQHALSVIVNAAPDALLVVVGDAPADALHTCEQTRESIQATANAAGIGQHLRFLGRISDMELTCAYECAALHVFPVRSLPGDPEGFGMVAIEAAAHGLPTVAFASGGIVDAVAPGLSGELVMRDDYTALARAVIQVLNTDTKKWQICATAFAQRYNWSAFREKLHWALGIPLARTCTANLYN
ncbi:MAG: D-inositol-3-phosphate glycosyltransferase [Pseudomonadales bacterium]|nr:D-inositol-3-phosphate glycosyltransferase [Pseudomonadales bacterium]